eukprot:38526_1
MSNRTPDNNINLTDVNTGVKQYGKYMSCHKSLKLSEEFWISKYEKKRLIQLEQQKTNLAASTSSIHGSVSPYNNESTDSLFNVAGSQVLKQIKCITSPSDIKLKTIQELFYQSNPTMIPMDIFEINSYMKAHIDQKNKYRRTNHSKLLHYRNIRTPLKVHNFRRYNDRTCLSKH